MRELKTIDEVNFKGRRVLIRFDFNVPVKDGVIQDDERIVQSLPTLNLVLSKGGIPVIMAHFGRPKGEANPKYSLAPVAKRLEELIGKKVVLLGDITSDATYEKIKAAEVGDVILLENIRFEKGEEKNDKELSKALSKFANVYINDAFGCAHRNHASTEGVTHFIDDCYAGFLMKKEIDILSKLRKNADAPFVVIVGGSKVSSKISVLESFLKIADKIVIAGAMAYTFLKAQGHAVGKSMVEDDYLETALSFLNRAAELKKKIVLPSDHVCAKEFDASAEPVAVNSVDIPEDLIGMDIGEKTLADIKKAIGGAKTVFWNGPAGVFEFDNFAKGTNEIARMITSLRDAKTVVGGGDSVSAIKKSGLSDKIYHVSTGGGASLEFLEGRYFDSLTALYRRGNRRKLVAGNWKMNITKPEGLEIATYLRDKADVQNVEIALCPEFPLLDCVASTLSKSQIDVYAQNVNENEKGAYTGEVSCEVVKSVGVRKTILGHSERREFFTETNSLLNKKLKRAFEYGFDVILCVGEDKLRRKVGSWKRFLAFQLTNCLKGISPADAKEHLIIAYEPIWAIGTGKSATAEDAEEAISYIRGRIAKIFSERIADNIKILYGGSVTPENANEIMTQNDIDGVLVGGASLNKEKFSKICEVAAAL
ncbi:MAG TPA: triose-phosphate isomerase [Spirochaetaceae bacterium]|nr:triose-phosphate isomerase [Spirochaetaceae bacterium]